MLTLHAHAAARRVAVAKAVLPLFGSGSGTCNTSVRGPRGVCRAGLDVLQHITARGGVYRCMVMHISWVLL